MDFQNVKTLCINKHNTNKKQTQYIKLRYVSTYTFIFQEAQQSVSHLRL